MKEYIECEALIKICKDKGDEAYEKYEDWGETDKARGYKEAAEDMIEYLTAKDAESHIKVCIDMRAAIGKIDEQIKEIDMLAGEFKPVFLRQFYAFLKEWLIKEAPKVNVH